MSPRPQDQGVPQKKTMVDMQRAAPRFKDLEELMQFRK
jgi:hypothetical protein